MIPDLDIYRSAQTLVKRHGADAQAASKDYLSQTEEAVRTVRQVRPDMTASDALAAVNLVRRL